MKRIYIYLSLLIVAIIASSCESFLTEDPKGTLTPDALYTDNNGLDNWTVEPYFKNGINVAPNKGATYGYTLEPDIRTLVKSPDGDYSHEIVFRGFLSLNWWQFASAYNEFPEEAGGWCDLLPELDFFNHFPEGRRKDAYFFTTIYISGSNQLVLWDDPSTNQRHPHFKKNVDAVSIGSERKILLFSDTRSRNVDRTGFEMINEFLLPKVETSQSTSLLINI